MRISNGTILTPKEYKECYGTECKCIDLSVPCDGDERDDFKFASKEVEDVAQVTDEEIYGKAIAEFYSGSDRSEEAYFGDNNEYKMGMIALFTELRETYNNILNADKKKDKKRIAEDIVPICTKIEKHIEKSFNIEKCYLGLSDQINAYAYPLCWDANLVEVKKDGRRHPKRFVNEKHRASLDDIMETKNGYKYRDKKDKIYVLNFGTGFLDPKFTAEECAAIITHELGHSMQQAMCGINQNLATCYIKNLWDNVSVCLNPLVIIGSCGLSLLVAAATGSEYSKAKKADDDEVADQMITQGIGAQRKEFDRTLFGENEEDQREEVVKNLPKAKKPGFFAKIGNFIVKCITSTFSFIFDILSLVVMPLEIPANIFTAATSGFLKKNRRWEQFADMFTAVYGLGPAQASALTKLGNISEKQQNGVFNLLNYVPVLNLAIGVGHYTNVALQSLQAGYPTMKKRVASIYKTLEIELKENKDLTAEQKATIKENIDQLNDIYNDYVYDWSPKGVVYALYNKFAFKRLTNEKTDVNKNVLECLKEMEKERKFKEAKEKKTSNGSSLNQNFLVSACVKVVNSFRNLGVMKLFVKEQESNLASLV